MFVLKDVLGVPILTQNGHNSPQNNPKRFQFCFILLLIHYMIAMKLAGKPCLAGKLPNKAKDWQTLQPCNTA